MANSYVHTSVRGFIRGVKVSVVNDTATKITFSIPHEQSFYDKKTKEWRKNATEWFNFELWGDPSNKWFQSAIKNIVDGAEIVIDNCVRKTDSYEDKSGVKRERVIYKVVDYKVMGRATDNEESTDRGKAAGAGGVHREEAAGSVFDEPAASGNDGDLPF